MDNSISTKRTNQDAESRVTQDHNAKVRKLKAEQEAEISAMQEKHARDKASLEKAYTVELGAKQTETSTGLQDITQRHQAMMTDMVRRNEAQMRQAQETYRGQQDQFRTQSETKLNKLREQETEAASNIERKANKGNA